MQVHYCSGKCDYKSRFVVISVLFELTDNTTAPSVKALENLWGYKNKGNFEVGDSFEQVKKAKKKKYDQMQKTKEKVDLAALYRLDSGFYHYRGSSTYPPCKEGKQYLVQSIPVGASAEQLANIKKKIGYPGNSRPIQSRVYRDITYFSDHPDTHPPPSTMAQSYPRPSGEFHPHAPEWAKTAYCTTGNHHRGRNLASGSGWI